MKFYHYTSMEHLEEILTNKKLELTPSNLLKPIKPHLVNGNFIDSTDFYKPVVWLTDFLSFKRAIKCGLTFEKTEAVLEIDNPVLNPQKWVIWAKENNINAKWFETLKKTAPEYKSFYVCENTIPIDNHVKVAFRPDIKNIF